MTTHTLNLDDSQHEHIAYFSQDFLYRALEYSTDNPNGIPWHWHEALEFVHVLEGEMVFQFPQNEVHIPAGGVLIINSGVFHAAGASNAAGFCRYRNHQIRPDLLAGSHGSHIRTHYFDPVLQCSELPYYLIDHRSNQFDKAFELFNEAYHASISKNFLYELKVRSLLSQLWLMFIENTQQIWRNSTPKNDVRSERIKCMLTFIQDNCAERMTLDDIAASAGISTRECLRCFQSMLKMTPFEYLLDCRTRRAADMLHNRSDSITDIALNCGFSSASYFCRVFKRIMGHSPSEYKRLHRVTPA